MQPADTPSSPDPRPANPPATSIVSNYLRLLPILVLGLGAFFLASWFGAPLAGVASDPHAAEVQDLRNLSAAELKSAEPGSEVLVSGRITGQFDPGYRGLAIVRIHSPDSSQQGADPKGAGSTSLNRSPAFILAQTEVAVPVLADTYKDKIWNAPHHGQTVSQNPKQQGAGEMVYDGFQVGEVATVKGKVVVAKDGQRSIEAQILFGGTPEEFVKAQGASGLATFLNIVGLFFLLLFCLLLARRIRQHRRQLAARPP